MNEVAQNSARAQRWLERLQSSGYRLTAPRQLVVEIMAGSRHTLNPTEVYLQAHQSSENIGLVTVYRTLEKLEELGLITRVHHNDGCHSYIYAAEGHQHLLICRRCNHAEYFAGDNLHNLIEALGEERGFLISEHWLQLIGLCPACRQDDHQPASN